MKIVFDIQAFSVCLKMFMHEHDYTHYELAAEVGTSQQIISKLTLGLFYPRIDVYYSLCLLMGKDMGDFFKFVKTK